MTGEQNWRRYLDGDDEGLVEIIRDHKDGLMLYLNNFCGNIGVAEELMEETFTKLAIKRPKFSGKSSFKTWLYAIGRNTAMDHLRHQSRFSPKPIEEHILASEKEELERQYIRKEQMIHLHQTMEKLSEPYRQVLYLVYFEEFTNDEVAQVMKKSKRQIENLLYRAKAALKNLLEKEGFVYEEL